MPREPRKAKVPVRHLIEKKKKKEKKGKEERKAGRWEGRKEEKTSGWFM
jgi:hypothetical protein